MRKINWKNDVILTKSGDPGKLLVGISAGLWCIASVFFALCIHSLFLDFVVPGNSVYRWLDNIPALPIGIVLTLSALGLLSFNAIKTSAILKKESVSHSYDTAKKHHWENVVYREIRQIASPTTKVFFYQLEEYNYRQAYAYLLFCIEVFSFGRITIEDLPKEGDSLNEWRTSLNLEKQHVQDLCDIWAEGLSGIIVHLNTYDTNSPRKFQELGRVLGIDNMVEAYFAGVPLADIII